MGNIQPDYSYIIVPVDVAYPMQQGVMVMSLDDDRSGTEVLMMVYLNLPVNSLLGRWKSDTVFVHYITKATCDI